MNFDQIDLLPTALASRVEAAELKLEREANRVEALIPGLRV
jgi:hypothetical protein